MATIYDEQREELRREVLEAIDRVLGAYPDDKLLPRLFDALDQFMIIRGLYELPLD